ENIKRLERRFPVERDKKLDNAAIDIPRLEEHLSEPMHYRDRHNRLNLSSRNTEKFPGNAKSLQFPCSSCSGKTEYPNSWQP
ncbi:MAG: hypothetical protein ACRESZ_11990, partial [Methylococcales bacterium]